MQDEAAKLASTLFSFSKAASAFIRQYAVALRLDAFHIVIPLVHPYIPPLLQ